MEKNDNDAASKVFWIPELVTLIVSYSMRSPLTIFNIARVSKCYSPSLLDSLYIRHNDLVWSDQLWKPFGIVAKNRLKREQFRVRNHFAEREKAFLRTQLETIERVLKTAVTEQQDYLQKEKNAALFASRIDRLKTRKTEEQLEEELDLQSAIIKDILLNEAVAQKVMEFLPSIIGLLKRKTEAIKHSAFVWIKNLVAANSDGQIADLTKTIAQLAINQLSLEIQPPKKGGGASLPDLILQLSKQSEIAYWLVEYNLVPRLFEFKHIVTEWQYLEEILIKLALFHPQGLAPQLLKVMHGLDLSVNSKTLGGTLSALGLCLPQATANQFKLIDDSGVVPKVTELLSKSTGFAGCKKLLFFLFNLVKHSNSIKFYLEKSFMPAIENIMHIVVNPEAKSADETLSQATKLIWTVAVRDYDPIIQSKVGALLLNKLFIEKRDNSSLKEFATTGLQVATLLCSQAHVDEKQKFIEQGVIHTLMQFLALKDPQTLGFAVSSLMQFFTDNDKFGADFSAINIAKELGIKEKLLNISQNYGKEVKLMKLVRQCLDYFKQ